ncbi:uncharacterized protein LOC135684291 isoform X3 [Rhopilema esculentum]|uniref:uncharacterized protein LOC135684291 isoform X3 n=1 Tax=Rhopilema esculentum TaxID=499914 RepID=UPI0031DE983B
MNILPLLQVSITKMNLNLVLLAICVVVAKSSASGTCPVSLGEFNTNDASEDQSDTTSALISIQMNCTGIIYGINLNATESARIDYAIGRELTPRGQNGTVYFLQGYTSVTTRKGLNVFKLPGLSFEKNDIVVLFSTKNILRDDNGSLNASMYLFSHRGFALQNISSSNVMLNIFSNSTPRMSRVPVMLILRESYALRVKVGEQKESNHVQFEFKAPLEPVQAAQIQYREGNLTGAELQFIWVDNKGEPITETGYFNINSIILVEVLRKYSGQNIVIKVKQYHFKTEFFELVLEFPVSWSWSSWSHWASCLFSDSSNTTTERRRERQCIYMNQQTSFRNCPGNQSESIGCTPPCSECTSSCFPCGGNMNCATGQISAEIPANRTHYPTQYCTWIIERPVGFSIELTFIKLDVGNWECANERISVFDGVGEEECLVGVLCRRKIENRYRSNSNAVQIVFKSGERSDRSAAFNITYTSYQMNTSNGTQPTTCQTCGGIRNSTNGIIMPRLSLDGTYLPNENCLWRIICPEFQIIFFKIENVQFSSTNDFLELREFVNGGEYLYVISSDLEFYSLSNSVNLTFRSSRNRQSLGFRIHYQALNYSQYVDIEPTRSGSLYNYVSTIASGHVGAPVLAMTPYMMTPNMMTPYMTSSVLPQVPRKTSHFCHVSVLIDWSSWNECSPYDDDTFYGTRYRERICKQITIQKDNGCLVSNTSNCHVVEETFLKDSEDTCNITCIRNGSSVCDSSFNFTQVGCISSLQQNETCRAKRRCVIPFYGQWSEWSSCQLIEQRQNYSNGVQSRNRVCTKISYVTKFSNQCTISHTKKKICPYSQIYKNEHSYQSPESPYTVCDSRCIGNNTQVCKATIVLSNRCRGASTQQMPCNVTLETATIHSSLDCNVTTCGPIWTNWGDCTNLCGRSTRSRYAACTKDNLCDDYLKQTEPCSLPPCAVNGAWTEWGSWSDCNKTCIGGIQTRVRSCNNPAPRNGGLDCFGISNENMECNFRPCPVDGKWAQWSAWSYCDQPCNSGRSWRRRRCDSPAPEFGGLPCPGAESEYLYCNHHECSALRVDAMLDFTTETYATGLNQSLRSQLHAELKNDVMLIFNNSNIIDNVTVDCHFNDTLSCGISIFFKRVAKDGIVLFQNQIEDVGYLNSMAVSNWVISSNDTPSAPLLLTCQSLSPTEIRLQWDRIVFHKKIAGYVIYYRELGKSTWERIAESPLANNYTVADLKQFTLHTFRVSASTMHGNGISTNFIDCITVEGAPLVPPRNFQCRTTSFVSLYLEWDHLPDYEWRGIRSAYNIEYRSYKSFEDWKNVSVPSDVPFFSLTNLKPFTMYEVKVSAATRSGRGPSSWIYCKTAEGVPTSPPSKLRATLITNDGDILVQWSELPKNVTDGVLTGYKLCHSVVLKSDEKVQYEVEHCSILPEYANADVVKGFALNVKVMFKVAGITAAGSGPFSPPVYIETCLCPRNVYVSWYESKPYIHGTLTSEVSGLLASFVKGAIQHECGLCSGKADHMFGNVTLYFNKTKSGKRARLKNENELKNRLSNDAHIFMPILIKQCKSASQENLRQVLVLEDPGFVLIVKEESSKLRVLINIIATAWPPVAVCILLGTLLGILLWFLERKENPVEFNVDSYIRGLCSGAWWGYITMTTVGYGDITPKSYYGKLVSIVWMLVGPVLNGMVVGIITTGLTTSLVGYDTNLNGKTVATVANSSQYNFAVRRNAKVFDGDCYINHPRLRLTNILKQSALLPVRGTC